MMITLMKFRELDSDLNYHVTEISYNNDIIHDNIIKDKYIEKENGEYVKMISTEFTNMAEITPFLDSNSEHYGLIEVDWPLIAKLMEVDIFGQEL